MKKTLSDGSKSEPTADGNWLLEPPEKGTIKLVFEAGKDVKLSQTQRQALEDLLRELKNSDDKLPNLKKMKMCPYKVDCDLGNCQPLFHRPCYEYIFCRIVDCNPYQYEPS